MSTIKIIIADDHTLFINGLQLLIKEEPGIEVIDIVHNGKELLDILDKKKPDIILLDINMPVINGLDSIKYIKQEYPDIKIIVLSTYSEDHLIEKARNLGANGYLLKNSNKDELLETIRLVNNNHTSFPYKEPKTRNAFAAQDDFLKQFNLTKREAEIIQLLKAGMTNQQISDKLFLSIYTIETHRKNIMQKLNLNKPSSLMKFIFENGL